MGASERQGSGRVSERQRDSASEGDLERRRKRSGRTLRGSHRLCSDPRTNQQKKQVIIITVINNNNLEGLCDRSLARHHKLSISAST